MKMKHNKKKILLPKPTSMPIIGERKLKPKPLEIEEDEEDEEETVSNVDEVVRNETATQITILDHAMEESGIISQDLPAEVVPGQDDIHDTVEDEEKGNSGQVTSTQSLTTAPHGLTKRRTKQQREAEVTLALLEEETEQEQIVRKQREAKEIICMAEKELDEQKFAQFLEILSRDGSAMTGKWKYFINTISKLYFFCCFSVSRASWIMLGKYCGSRNAFGFIVCGRCDDFGTSGL